MAVREDKESKRLLILTPFGKDSAHLCKVLGAEGFQAVQCPSTEQLVEELGSGVGAILTTEEVLASKENELLKNALKEQPAWSAIPLLVFFTQRDGKDPFQRKAAEPIHEITDINFLQRPVSSLTLVSAIRGALRDRERQYRTKELLDRLQEDLDTRARHEAELKKAHSEAAEAQRIAENANRTKSQFLANMSHEIRTPLGAIMGYADLISQPGTMPREIDDYVSVIRRNSKQLLRIIDDILDLSKVEAGKIEFENFPFSLFELLEDFSELVELRARERNVHFEMHGDVRLPKRIVSDPTRIRQILWNVVGNAIKFSEGGSVVLSVSLEDNFLTFEVKDDGRGISEEQVKLLFQPFTQADSSTTRKFGGTGLGLALTKRLCEAMGGDFVLKESALKKGSTFVARIATQVAEKVDRVEDYFAKVDPPHDPRFAPFTETLESQRLSGSKILLVEDSPDIQELIRILLQKAGAEVHLAADGKVGLEKATNDTYSAIVMDVQMPRMSGIESVRLMREKGITLPIVALTAHAMKEERERCLKAGFTHFLPKPVDKETLLNLLQDAIHPVASVKRASPKLLIVEDDDDTRELLSEFLVGEGYGVAAAETGEAVLSYLEANETPGMILLDLSLPGMGGAGLMKVLNQRKDRNLMKVILVSGWGDLPERVEMLQADGFMKKPIELDCIVKTIEGYRTASSDRN